ncbi:MAG: hypothetical protein QW478_15475 [Candidatus Micrarchaeaceae archaeon]
MQNISLLILALFPLLGIANAQTLVLPHGIAYSNQMLNISKSNYNNLANFEFFYSNGTIIPAWVEINSSGVMPAVICNNTSTNNTLIWIAFIVLFIVSISMSILCLIKGHKHK